jgi:superfamily II helicase
LLHSQRRIRVPQIACFDTGYHATMPETETRFALPLREHEQESVATDFTDYPTVLFLTVSQHSVDGRPAAC